MLYEYYEKIVLGTSASPYRTESTLFRIRVSVSDLVFRTRRSNYSTGCPARCTCTDCKDRLRPWHHLAPAAEAETETDSEVEPALEPRARCR